MSTTRILLENLENVADTAHLEKALEAVPGVHRVQVHLESSSATVEHEGADLRQLTTAVNQAGYHAKVTS